MMCDQADNLFINPAGAQVTGTIQRMKASAGDWRSVSDVVQPCSCDQSTIQPGHRSCDRHCLSGHALDMPPPAWQRSRQKPFRQLASL